MTSVDVRANRPAPQSGASRALIALAVWLLPALFCYWLYAPGLTSWFQQDDFAWLGLPLQLHQASDLWRLLFEPMAQGTVRPISERGFFLVFTSLFGIDALPFRVCVFVTAIADVLLLSSVVLHLTHSRLAAAAAPVLWLVNCGLSVPMSWTSAYNQILFGFCLLAAFRLYLKYVQTGQRKFYVFQLIVFLLGFGVLELNVVYPVLVIVYAALLARPFLRPALPLLAPAALFAIVHRMNAPAQVAPGYAIQVDERIFSTFYTYWQWLLGPSQLSIVKHVPGWFAPAGTLVLTVAILAYTICKTLKKQYLPLFFLASIVIVLAPVLPLPGHISDYYLTLPAIGLAALGALALADAVAALSRGRNARALLRAAAAAGCLFLYVYAQLPLNRVSVAWWHRRSLRAQGLVEGVATAAARHPGKTILLASVDNDLFWAAVYDSPFQLYGLHNVFLVPGSERALKYDPAAVNLAQYLVAPRAARRALDRNQAVVYDAGRMPIHNITTIFTRSVAETWPAGFSPEVNVTDPLYADQLGRGWYDPEQGFRWTHPQATLRLGRGDTMPHSVSLSGYCVAVQTQSGPLEVRLTVNGIPLIPRQLTARDAPFKLEFPLPGKLLRETTFEVTIDVDPPTVIPGESRKLGLAVTSVRLQ
ncbi:MAG: hypothetical protein IT160_12945 [Bryobacterales bacterium]|nr:hypothetical protein [Bryobacterales bacterium]